MLNPKFIDDLARQISDNIPAGVKGLQADVEKNIHTLLQGAFSTCRARCWHAPARNWRNWNGWSRSWKTRTADLSRLQGAPTKPILLVGAPCRRDERYNHTASHNG
jgi:hypothetical protein